MKKFLIAVALLGLVAGNAEADGGHGSYHGGGSYGHYYGGGHGYYYGNESYFWWGAALGAALTIPFYYSQAWANPGPYYYSPGPTVYVNPPVYVQSQPVYVQSQPVYAMNQFQPGYGVRELGPVSTLPGVSSNTGPGPGEAPAVQAYVYPSKGQTPRQQASDRYECNRWAVNESGYDPDLRTHRNPETGPVAYGRALSACLEGRGYAVR